MLKMLKGFISRCEALEFDRLLPVLLVAGFPLLYSCAALTARAELNTVKTAGDVAAQTTVKSDSFKGTTFISGPTFKANDPNYGIHWHLWTRPDDDMCYLSLRDLRMKWAFFEHAADAKGRQFPVVQQDRRVATHMVEERLYLSFPLAYVKAHADSGTTIKVWGLRGEEVFDVPGYYLAGFLQGITVAAK